jgi:peptide/nickel transport system substrate-binding protein
MRIGPPPLALRTRRAAAATVAVACLVTVGACDFADATDAPPEPKKGGTLFVNVQAGLDILDPQRTYAAVEMNVLRLTTRTLTTYRSTPGAAASEIVPDLATDTGRPSEGNTVWDFELKPNIRWEGGEPVTCANVKYGIERRFSELINEGAPYPREYLRDNATPYEGPWIGNNNNGRGLESIECVDQGSIRFHLSKPVGDFNYTVAMSTFAPVLPDKDTKTDYTKRPYSNGPYKLESRDAEKIVFVRNNFWTHDNDQVRKAYPDRIVIDFRQDAGGVLTNELIEDQGEARNTVMLDINVAPNFLQQVINDPELVSRAVTGPTGAVRFLAINTKRVPDIACRQAYIYAFNKRKWRAVNGGSVTGDYATTIIPPGVKAHKNFDVFGSSTNPEGDPDKAAGLLRDRERAGKPCKTRLKAAYPDNVQRRRLMTTVVEAFQLAGVEVELEAVDPITYYNTGAGDPTNDFDLIWAGWVPDWANGSAILPPLFDGDVIPEINPVTGHAAGNVNFPLLNNPRINEQIDAALAESSPERQYALWGELDQQIQEQAVTVPILYEKAVRMTGSNVAGGFIHPAFGQPDLCALGLLQP